MYHGLVRIQYSVFAGDILENDINKLSKALFDMDLEDEDNITVFTVCPKCQTLVKSVKPLPQSIKHLSI
ncbi:MAG: associated protein Cas2 [Methanolobus sp.]|jgi:CRISPR-associated protein Cas2|nr:associated protein Cas2 [Methanolobus sp.]